MSTYIFRVDGMHCGSCALLVDDALEDLPGVLATQTVKGRSTVELDVNRTGPDDVIKVIEDLGYRASPLP